MRISRDAKDSVVELARRFTRHSPNLCREHSVDGLPVDAPEGVDNISENHPSYKFEKIVKQEADKNGGGQVMMSRVREKLREEFAKEFFKGSDEISCIKCFEKRKESDKEISVRMELPDDWSIEER